MGAVRELIFHQLLIALHLWSTLAQCEALGMSGEHYRRVQRNSTRLARVIFWGPFLRRVRRTSGIHWYLNNPKILSGAALFETSFQPMGLKYEFLRRMKKLNTLRDVRR
ncbi:hypothetical protein BC835DRAFT_673224 [Cytidiella melzeri]|nr:hypothetical protein BC835DRAFT_673224 [Cytidiella melzeri]